MKNEFDHRLRDVRQKIFSLMERSTMLDTYIGQILSHDDHDLRGVLLSGHPGSGKTFFVENYLQKFDRQHPVLIARHHHQHRNIPYFGFKYCISDYLSKIYTRFNKTELQEFSGSMKEYLGESFPLLLDYIPELSLISGQESDYSQRSSLAVENQLYPLFKRLFEFLADHYQRTVFFFTDDLQWIDASGANLLKYLLLHLSPDKLVWIGASRTPYDRSGMLGQLAEELDLNNRRVANIVLKGLHKNEVEMVVETMLGNPCHEALTDICYNVSEGNLSHLQSMLENLTGTGHLWQVKGVWHCDPEVIKQQYTREKANRMLLGRMDNLAAPTYEVLSVIACMGRFNRRIIIDWLNGDVEKMNAVLDEARDAGFLGPDKNDIRFSEIPVGEMFYNALPTGRKSELHYKIAKLFYARGTDRLSGPEVILMATSFNQSVDRVKANGEQQLCAALNYKAGKISEQDNALEQSRSFYKMSAELLKDCSWDQVSELVTLVYMERARIEYYLGDYDLAEIHLDYLLERLADPVRRTKVFELKVIINNRLGRYRKVVRILKEILSELGLNLPLEESQLQQEVQHLKSLLSKKEKDPTEKVLNEALDESHRHAILKLLYVGGMGLHHTSDVLMTWAALQIILTSGENPHSVVKAIGYVSYGRMLIISGDIDKGFEFGLKGIAINNSLNDITLRCRVYGVYAFYIQPWKKAFSESNEWLTQAAIAGKKAGDLIGLYILKTHQLNLHLISGLPLRDVLPLDFEESYPGMELTYYITHYQMSLLKFLKGESAVFSMPRQDPSWLAGKLTVQEEKFYRNYVWARYYFLFGNYALATRSAQEAYDNRKLQEGSPLLPANLMIWFLSVTQSWTDQPEDNLPALHIKLQEVLQSFSIWQTHAPSNYKPAWYLLKAEYARIEEEYDAALEYYHQSAEASGANIYHLAVTNELLAKYLLTEPQKQEEGRVKLAEAIQCYHQWGGLAKVKQLTQQYQAILPVAHPYEHGMNIETLQFELSGDMEVASLVKKLLVLLLRISGSTHVILELVENSGERILYDSLSLLSIAAEKKPRPITNSIPVSMILMALKSQNTMVVNDLTAEKDFHDLEGMQERGVQSFLILPVTINGHLSMVIYLENTLAKDWYIQERVKSARITANQGAVIIENARIHERSIRLNEEIRKEMAEKERLATILEAQKDTHLKALIQTQNNERKRIARDLHDSVGSLLSSVKLRFNGLQDEFVRNVPEKTTKFTDAIKLLDDAIQELREISHTMLPESLSRFGLQSALETFVQQVNAPEQLDVDLQVLGLELKLPEEIEVAVYRICQELVQNVIKHAGASSMRIQIIHHKESLNIIVEDNGKGMVKNEISPGFGFRTIQSTVDLFRGTFAIESQPGKGSMVLVDIYTN
jgi:signal transduction histidine kinase/predicted ATPase